MSSTRLHLIFKSWHILVLTTKEIINQSLRLLITCFQTYIWPLLKLLEYSMTWNHKYCLTKNKQIILILSLDNLRNFKIPQMANRIRNHYQLCCKICSMLKIFWWQETACPSPSSHLHFSPGVFTWACLWGCQESGVAFGPEKVCGQHEAFGWLRPLWRWAYI